MGAYSFKLQFSPEQKPADEDTPPEQRWSFPVHGVAGTTRVEIGVDEGAGGDFGDRSRGEAAGQLRDAITRSMSTLSRHA
jgi:hypothetical protein